MPQMAPIYWLFMLLFFSVSFLFFIVMNYFIKSSEKMISTDKLIKSEVKNWKW